MGCLGGFSGRVVEGGGGEGTWMDLLPFPAEGGVRAGRANFTNQGGILTRDVACSDLLKAVLGRGSGLVLKARLI